MDTETQKAFEADLQALLDKYDVVLFAQPTYVNNNGLWQQSAEIKMAKKPKTPEPDDVASQEVA